jgi:hypothetical protein
MPTIYDRLLLAKVETTKNTDAVPVVGTNAIRIKTGKLVVTTDIKKRTVVKQTMGELPHLIGNQTLQLDLEIENKSSGAAGTAPEVGTLLKGCGILETISAGVSAAYAPLSTISNHKSLTLYWYDDGLLWKLIGAVGKHSFDAKIGEAGTWKFTFQADFIAPTVVSCPTGAVYQSAAPIVMSSTDIINDGTAIKVGAFSLDDAGEIQHHLTTGGDEFVFKGRNPKVKFGKDSISTATEWAALTAGINAALSATFGSTVGSRLVLTAPVARRDSVANTARGERPTLEIAYGLYESTGDDQYNYLFN